MSELTGIIPQQAFEVIRDRLGAILSDELNNQFVLTGNADFDLEVWIERFIPFDKEELPAINVSFSGGPYAGHTVKQSEGTYTYFVDVHTKAKTTEDDKGDALATTKLHRLLGMCRSILENPSYKNLGFVAPYISNRHIERIDIADPGKQDAISERMGRLSVSVRVVETTELIDPPPLVSNLTTIKMSTTEKGYFYAAYS
jgi:hypothetical protein